MIDLIESGVQPQHAVTQVVNSYVHLFSESTNTRLKEKVQDVKDLGWRLLHNLIGKDLQPLTILDKPLLRVNFFLPIF